MGKNKIIGLLVIGTLIMPGIVEAKGFSGCRSSSVRVSRPVSVKPSVKISKPATVKVTKPSTTKPTKVDLKKKPVTTTKVDTKKVTPKKETKPTLKVKKTIVKPVVKKKPVKVRTHYVPTYYNNYSSSNGLRLDNNFWLQYGIMSSMSHNNNVTERDVARELEKKGYSEKETRKIMDKARYQSKNNLLKNVIMYTLIILVGVGIAILMIVKSKRKK